MFSSSHLKRSTQSIGRIPFRRHLRANRFSFSSPPPFIASSVDPGAHGKPNLSRSLVRWISGVLTGSSIGVVLYCYSSSVSDCCVRSVMPFTDWLVDAAARLSLDDPLPTSKLLVQDSFRRKIFFNYEKRMRMRSSPVKVFEYFGTVRTSEGETLMTPADLMRAVVPVFPPSESNLVRDGYLRGERFPGDLHCAHSEFFMLFDVNNDGLISFKEYIFFVSLLSIPESSFSVAFKMFDIDNDGEIDRDEFKKVMVLMQTRTRQGALHRDGLSGLGATDSAGNGGLMEQFFGKDGKKRLHHDQFVQFLRDLHDEMIRLEFSHYEYKAQGTISGKDFALSIVASADIRHLSKLLDRVDEFDHDPHLSGIRVTFEEFKNFAELRKRLQPFSLALFSYGKVNGLLTRTDFQRAASQVCGISLSANVVDIVFRIFDSNNDGNLSSEEFVRVLQNRKTDAGRQSDDGIMTF